MELGDDLVRRVEGRLGTSVGGKWRLERVLGIGGMAAVYAAVHRNQNRVAIKMLHPELSIDAVVRQRFLREGYAANSVEHPGVVRVLDDDVTEDGAAFLVMELLEGESLEDRRERHDGRLPPSEVLALADQLLDVLIAAHEKGIVHRDIKPDNLFLTSRGELKVLDFGIAHLREVAPVSGGTSAGTFMGTPSYMSPEQARARWEDVDARSDLWAVGAVMFVLLSGRSVREATTVPEQLALAVRDPAPLLSEVAPALPDRVAAIVDRALAYDKGQRFQDARSMQAAVRDALRHVGRPESLSVPAQQSSGRRLAVHEADTMLASSDKPTATPVRSPTTGGAATMASSGAQPPPPPARSRLAWLLLLAFAAGLVPVALVMGRSTRGSGETTPLAAESTSPVPAASAPEIAPDVTAVVSAIPSSEPPPLASTSPATSATPAQRGPRAPLAALAPTRAPAPTASTPAAAPKNPPAAAADPFDKRF